MLDSDSAARLGNRKLGELADMVSQFEILPNYTQINYKGRPVRVTSLAYGDLIKWFTNRSNGLPAYIIIDMVTQEAEVVRLDEGMKYTTAEHFSRNLYRHLRFHYPTMMFDEPVFEIDEEGTPYWVCSRIVKRIGLFGGTDVKGAVLVNAVSGESQYYEDVPTWVDRLYSSDIIMDQYDYYGQFHNGFLNAYFGQRDVTLTTDGWNYIAINNDVYMYTGVTSVTSDQSNIGFILTNQRTKETRFYPCAGATETSAKSSAQSQVQQMRYSATFPLLLNIADQPTYFMALKGEDGLVKMYAMVNVQQYNIVETGQTVAQCEENYRKTLLNNGIIDRADAEVPAEEQELWETKGTIAEIRSAVIEGTSVYYLRFEGGGQLLRVCQRRAGAGGPTAERGRYDHGLLAQRDPVDHRSADRCGEPGCVHRRRRRLRSLRSRKRISCQTPGRRKAPAAGSRRSFTEKHDFSRGNRSKRREPAAGKMPAAGFLWELSKSKGKFWLAQGPLFIVNVHAVWYLCNNNIGGTAYAGFGLYQHRQRRLYSHSGDGGNAAEVCHDGGFWP